MATLISIDPTKSKRTGKIPFVITGTGFDTPDYSCVFPGSSYSDISSNGGVNTETNKLELYVDSQELSIAGVMTDYSFERSFDVELVFEEVVDTIPSIHEAKIAAIKYVDTIDPSLNYGEVIFGFKDAIGYFIKVIGVEGGNVLYEKKISIDPHIVKKLRLIRSENKITGYIVIDDKPVEVGSYITQDIKESKIQLYSQNAEREVTSSFGINFLSYKLRTIVSICNRPADILSITPTVIEGRTQENEVGPGHVVVAFPDTSYAELLNAFEYTYTQQNNRESKKIDMVISVYNMYIKPSRNELFTSGGSFKFDENYWIQNEKQNKNLYIPSLWDAVTANVANAAFQSGYGDNENIELVDIKKFKAEGSESWHARIKHGTFFVKNVPYYLHSNESITIQLGEELTADGRSYKNLKYTPKIGVPIIASTLTTDIESGLVIDKKRFAKRGKFTGVVQNGVELDTASPLNIDKTKTEFIVHYNSNNTVRNWRIPVEGSSAGVYSFILPSLPLKDYSIIFSRKDIFKNQKQSGSLYGESGTVYGEVLYGEPLEQIGDYSVNYITGEVQVWIDQTYYDMGYVTYTFDYPAKIEFNNNYLFDHGGDITNPTPSDLGTLDVVGESNGTDGQFYRLSEFPILDYSTSMNLDRNSFRLFLYDESDNSFDSEWIRVVNLKEYGPTDKVYQLNSDQGVISFGNGIHGMIPQKYKKIVCGYKTTVRIEYEPESSTDYWVGRDTDLNLSRNSLNSGFLYISRKELIPDTVSIRFSTDEINALEFAELSAVVKDRDGDPVPGARIYFEVINGNGNLDEGALVTNSDGMAKTTFIPSGSIEHMATFAYLFEPGQNEYTLGEAKPNVYFSSGTVLNNLLVAEQEIDDDPSDVYLFKVYDNNDAFSPYNNRTRTGGTHYVYYKENDPSTSLDNEIIRPTAINGKVLIFEDSLPQPFSSSEPNYEPNLRGFAIIGKKKIQAKAKVDAGMFMIDSDIASLKVKYSPIQKGEWTLPIPPAEYTSSEISRATYITINPDQSPNP